MQTLLFAIAPGLAWVISESLKLVLHSIRQGKLTMTLGQYGGMPSTHTTVVMTCVMMIGGVTGWAHPAFGVACTLAFVTMIDAAVFRQQIGRHAEAINRLVERQEAADRQAEAKAAKANDDGSDGAKAAEAAETPSKPLRVQLWHTPTEIAAGALLGSAIGLTLMSLMPAAD